MARELAERGQRGCTRSNVFRRAHASQDLQEARRVRSPHHQHRCCASQRPQCRHIQIVARADDRMSHHRNLFVPSFVPPVSLSLPLILLLLFMLFSIVVVIIILIIIFTIINIISGSDGT